MCGEYYGHYVRDCIKRMSPYKHNNNNFFFKILKVTRFEIMVPKRYEKVKADEHVNEHE